ncbi:class I SAM-dependent methyltransferase [Rhizobacter sp. LjRoot28]|jgi:SAM-dependent methyltransferase|uniref:class I SAM-dependent methyltransferase n=1 Tax=Rhizobacter sp. LjRoot28 TaxID=3342309 RepID=UPI003ECC504A
MNDAKEREREFHDARFAQDQDPRNVLAKYYSVTAASSDLFKRIVTERLGAGRNFLEYGCGTGGDFRFYKRLGCNLYGIDISREAIIKAQADAEAHGLTAEYSVQDAENTNFPAGTFDLVAGSGILHHLDLDRCLSELARITKPEGACVFSEPLGHNPAINLFRRMTPKLRTADEHPLVKRDFDLMRKYFDVVEVKHFYLFTLLTVALRKTPFFGRAYESMLRFDDFLISRFPGLGLHAWICIITLRRPRAQAQQQPSAQPHGQAQVQAA